MVKALDKTLEVIGEEATSNRLKRLLSPPEQYLFVLDTIALVRFAPGGRLHITPRKPEWKELLNPLLSEAEPYKKEIYRLVREREGKACFKCLHWHPLDGSFGICDLLLALCGRFYSCDKFERRVKEGDISNKAENPGGGRQNLPSSYC